MYRNVIARPQGIALNDVMGEKKNFQTYISAELARNFTAEVNRQKRQKNGVVESILRGFLLLDEGDRDRLVLSEGRLLKEWVDELRSRQIQETVVSAVRKAPDRHEGDQGGPKRSAGGKK